MVVKLLNEHNLEFLSLPGSSVSTLVKIPHCWKSHNVAHLFIYFTAPFKEDVRQSGSATSDLWKDS